jgi:transposase-like protein
MSVDIEYQQKREEKSYFNRHIMPRFDIIEGYARMGYTNKEIAERLGIVPKTLEKYLERADEDNKYAQLRLRLEIGREQTDILVENALLRRALGYKYKEITKERRLDPDTGEHQLVITKVVQKEVQPDVGACQYWLEHRAQKRWNSNPIAEANEQLANEAILKIADLINNPVPIREPEDVTKEYERLSKKPAYEIPTENEIVLDNLKKEKTLRRKRKSDD